MGNAGTQRIAIIDDDPRILRALRRLLDEHYAVDGYGAIPTALAGMRRMPPDLVLLDAAIEQDACASLIARMRPRAPIVTLADSRGERERCIAAGAADHLIKPLEDGELLLSAIADCLAGGRADLGEAEALRLRLPDGRFVELPIEVQVEQLLPRSARSKTARTSEAPASITLDLDHLERWLTRKLQAALSEGETQGRAIKLEFVRARFGD